MNRETGSLIYEEKDGSLLLAEADAMSKQVEEFPYFRPVDGEAQIKTVDGVKQKVLETAREYDRMLYHTRLSLKFKEEEVLFGLGQAQEGVWNLRGTVQYLHQANMKIAVPVLLSSEGYGILLSTQSTAIFEDDVYGSWLYTEADEYLDYYLIAGKLPEVVKGIRKLTGKAAMLPRWAFGYIQSKERYERPNMSQESSNYEEFRDAGCLLPNSNVYDAFRKEGRELYW